MKIQSLIILVLLSTSSPLVAEPSSSQRLDEVRQEIKTLNNDLSQKKADKETLYLQLKEQSKAVSALTRQLRELKLQIDTKKKDLASLEHDLGLQQQQQKAQLEALYDQIKSAYLHAQPNYLKILLNQEDVTTLSRSTTYYRFFHQARQEQLHEINNTLASLTEQQKQLLIAQQALVQLYENQQLQQVALQAESQKRESTLKQLEQSISSQDARLSALKSEEQNLQALLVSLAKQAEKAEKAEKAAPSTQKQTAWKPTGPFSRLTGKLPWPVDGKILARYGSPRNLGKLTWQGIVINSPTGNEIRATASGRIVFADWLRGFGLLIIIDHGEQYMTLYGNNETLLKEAGQVVQAGEIIAQSGKQGIRGLSGLYFEIRHKGNPTNPLKWLKQQG